jgi:hypothetical protein
MTTFDDQLKALHGRVHLQRATIEDNDVRTWEITLVDGQFCCYRLHDYGHRWIGRFSNFEEAYSKTAL